LGTSDASIQAKMVAYKESLKERVLRMAGEL
jgi:hypothetical protein